jgi:hypothetical protein
MAQKIKVGPQSGGHTAVPANKNSRQWAGVDDALLSAAFAIRCRPQRPHNRARWARWGVHRDGGVTPTCVFNDNPAAGFIDSLLTRPVGAVHPQTTTPAISLR